MNKLESALFVAAVTCSRPVAPENGRVNDVGIEFTYGNEVTYECNQGFRLDRMITGRCNENSTWGEVPSCICKYFFQVNNSA